MRFSYSPFCLFSLFLLTPSSVFASPYQQLIQKAAKKHALDPALIQAVIKQESAYNRFAVSPAGAQGLMQLMPNTAKRFKVTNAFIPAQNINAGSQYLAWLLKRFKGNIRFALAGYNAGEGKVDRYKGIPPYKETKKYVRKVMGYYRSFKTEKFSTITVSKRNYALKQRKAFLYAAQHLLVHHKPITKASKPILSTTPRFKSFPKIKTTKAKAHFDIISEINQKIIRLKPITTRIHSLSKRTFISSSRSSAASGYSRIHATAQRSN